MVALILAGCSFYNSEISSPAWCLWHQGSLDAVVDAIAHIHVKPPRLSKQGFVARDATTSAGRAKKDLGRCWQSVVAKAVAVCGVAEEC